MPSDLQVTNIKANDGTAGLVIADSTGQVTGTLGSGTVFPNSVRDRTYWYPLIRSATDTGSYYNYSTSDADANNMTAYLTAVAPVGFTSVVSAYFWWIATVSPSASYNANLAWSIGSDDADANTHSRTETNFYGSNRSGTNGRTYRQTFFGLGSDGTRFEQVIAANDVFGISVHTDDGGACRQLGIEITWRF